MRGLGVYERHLALVAAVAAGDEPGVQAALRDDQPGIRAAARGDLAGGLFAVELTRPGVAFGWSAPWRDVLLQLRHHPDPDVREEAYAIDMT
jgi:hypothetical protein